MSYSASFLQQTAIDALGTVQYSSRRSPVYGTRGMVACSQPLAAEAGLRVLQSGGNAADAAVAVAAALGVTAPSETGIGGDAFALFYSAQDRKVHCMQGNGASPAALTLERVRAAGITGNELPPRSPLTVSVPGAAALWEDAVQQWGNKTLADVLAPAIELAEQGFPVGPMIAFEWAKAAGFVQAAGGPGVGALLTPEVAAPRAGQVWVNKDLADTYRSLAEHGAAQGFYSGPIAEAVVAALQTRGGVMTLEDLAAHKTINVEPLSTTYRGHVVWEVPPPTAGVVALMTLNILEAHRQQQQQLQSPTAASPVAAAGQTPAGSSPLQPPQINMGEPRSMQWSVEQLHVGIEAVRMAFADALAWVADPLVHDQPVEELICVQRAQRRYNQYFNPHQACRPEPDHTLPPGVPKKNKGGDTCQWVVVDGDGNAASFIQSTYMPFGTGIVPVGCGFTLQNRCHGFILEPGHPNSLAPRKRPYHTIIPGMLTDASGGLVAAFGCMGAFMQPQGHVQLLFNMLELGLDPQAALDAPRFCVDRIDSAVGPASVLESHVLLEEGISTEAAEALGAKGHSISVRSNSSRSVFGKGQIIVRDGTSGVLVGGSDPRGDGCVMAW